MLPKNCLYLEGRFKANSANEMECSIETLISVFTLVCCENTKLQLCFVDLSLPLKFSLPSDVIKLFNFSCISEKQYKILECRLPAAQSLDGIIIGGLCVVLRWTIKSLLKTSPHHPCKNLLGFRGGCLTACSESSIWTKFCEVELLQIIEQSKNEKNSAIPDALKKLEEHLQCPVRTHNISRRKNDMVKKIKKEITNNDSLKIKKIDDNLPIEDAFSNLVFSDNGNDYQLSHCYLEGIDLTLADVIVLPIIHFVMEYYSFYFRELPYITQWYAMMLKKQFIKKTIVIFKWEEINTEIFSKPVSKKSYVLNDNSFYSRDRLKSKVKCRNFDPSVVITTLKINGIIPKLEDLEFNSIDWNVLPPELHPSCGDLPKKRLDRKCEQLQSIVSAVLSIALENQTIVDFCSGGGHVGLLLAYYLPKSKIILVENKEESISRAKKRATSLGLENIHFFQCNLGYFQGHFDIGVALHACGVSTDLVINKCLLENASFVVCPCCYGKIEDTSEVKYPLSKKFHIHDNFSQEFSMLTHCADRTEANTKKLDQGMYCMALIDTDRWFYATEHGYKTVLTTLKPITCSPKHNLLIGVTPLIRNCSS